jgi:hypothetical protein
VARGYAFVVVGLRLLIIAGWAAAVAAAIVFLPPLNPSTGGLSELIPPGSPAAHAESDASRLFGFPLDAAVAVVQRDPRGLPTVTQVRAVRQALAADRGVTGQLGQLSRAAQAAGVGEALATADGLSTAGLAGAASPGQTSPGTPGSIPGLAGAFALPNTAGLLVGTAEHSTTIITFLYFQPGTSFGQQTAGANEYVHQYLNQPTDHVIGVTGPIPAEYAQSQIIQDHVFWVELGTVLAIALILGLRFRSAGAPLAALACAGTAYVLAVRIVAWTAQRMGVALPPDLDPVLVVLLLGVTTDYSVFFLDGMRARLAEGVPRVQAAADHRGRGPDRDGGHGVAGRGQDGPAAGVRTGIGADRANRDGGLDDAGACPDGRVRRAAVPAGSAPAAEYGRPGPAGAACAVHRGPGGGGAPHGAADRRGLHGGPARGRLGSAGSAPRIAADQRTPGQRDRRAREHGRLRRLRAGHLVPHRDPGHRPRRDQADRRPGPAAA